MFTPPRALIFDTLLRFHYYVIAIRHCCRHYFAFSPICRHILRHFAAAAAAAAIDTLMLFDAEIAAPFCRHAASHC